MRETGHEWEEEEGEVLISFHIHQYDKTGRKTIASNLYIKYT